MGIGAMVGGSLISGLMSSNAASNAADAQADAASEAAEVQREALALQEQIYNQNVELQQPWYDAGTNALAAYQYELGLGPMPGTTPQVIEQTTTPAAGGQTQGGGQVTPEAMSALNLPTRQLFGEGVGGVTARPGSEGNQYFYNGDSLGTFDNRAAARNALAGYAAPGGNTTAAEPTTTYSVNGETYDTMDAAQQAANAASGFEYQGFQATPGYQYGLDQSQEAINRNAAARGMRLSGATLNALATDAQGRQNQEYNNWLNRIGGVSTTGQNAAAQQAAAGQNYGTAYQSGANTIGNTLMQAGDARASGYMGQANALNNTLNNLAGVYGYAQSGMFGPNPGFGITPSPTGLAAYGYS